MKKWILLALMFLTASTSVAAPVDIEVSSKSGCIATLKLEVGYMSSSYLAVLKNPSGSPLRVRGNINNDEFTLKLLSSKCSFAAHFESGWNEVHVSELEMKDL